MRFLKTVTLIALATLSLSACGPKAPPAPPPTVVSVAAPLSQRVIDWDDFTGRFESPAEVQVRARTGGYLQAVHFRDGQLVRKGQLLFTLDPRPAQAQLAAAQAQAELARADLKRAEALLAAQAISREDYEGKRAAAQVAGATLRARALDVEFTRVTAPVSGLISARQVDPGNVIAGGTSSGDVLATLVSVDPIHFVFDASEAQLLKYQRQPKTRQGSPVRIRLQDETEPRWSGVIDYSASMIDNASGTARMRAVVRNPNSFLKPGMFGSARVMGSSAYSALLIPDTAVVSDGPRKVAYTVSPKGEIGVQVLQLGPQVGSLRVIRAGLRPDDQVVVSGVQRVRPGLKVQAQRVALPKDSAPASAPVAPTVPSSTATLAG